MGNSTGKGRRRGGLPPGAQGVVGRGRDTLARMTGVTPAGTRPAEHELVDLELDHVRFVHQPRKMLPDDLVTDLIAAGALTPRRMLEALQRQAGAGDEPAQRVLDSLQELAASIASAGVEQPISAYQAGEGYVVKVGHRRCMAAVLARKETVPAVMKERPGSPLELLRDQLAENLQREDMSPLDRATALAEMRAQIQAHLVSDLDENVFAETSSHFRLSENVFAELVQTLGIGPTALHELQASAGFDEMGEVQLTSRDLDRLSLAFLSAITGFQTRRLQQMMEVERVVLPPDLTEGLTESHLRQVARLETDLQPLLAAAIHKQELGHRDTATVVKCIEKGQSLADAVTEVVARRKRARRRRKLSKTAAADSRLAKGVAQIQAGLGVVREALDAPDVPTPAALEAARNSLSTAIQDLQTLDRTLQAKTLWGRQRGQSE